MKLWNFTNPKIKKVMDFKPMTLAQKYHFFVLQDRNAQGVCNFPVNVCVFNSTLIVFLQYVVYCIYFDFIFVLPAAEHKCLKRGVKEVVKSIRRGHKGSVFCEIPLLTVGFSKFKSMKGA